MELSGKKAGRYILASMPRVGPSPVPSIVTCLGRQPSYYSEKFFTIKILTIKDPANETYDERQGKMLLHTEYTLLSLLHKLKGVVHSHDFFKDEAAEETDTYGELGQIQYTGRTVTRYCLVLDCLVAHDYSNKNDSLINLQHYVIKEKQLTEREALSIFINIVKTVADLHKLNIVHRDLKLGNMILDKATNDVTITNFCLGKHLISDDDVLRDQRGSPAYISPEVLSGQPYKGKPSDVWALGVVLYTMLYGQFPFYDQVPQELFKKIKSVHYDIPSDGRVSSKTKDILKKLLTLNASSRYTATQLYRTLQDVVSQWHDPRPTNEDQIVPESTVKLPPPVQDRPSVIQRHDSRTISELERFLLNADREDHAAGIADSPLVPSSESSATVLVGVKRKAPPVRRLSEDARPLSNLEMDMYRNKRVLHTPAPPPSTSNLQSATAKHNEYQRKLLELRMRTHGKTPYATTPNRTDLRSRTLGRIPMTPAIAPTTISLTPLETPLPRTSNPFSRFTPEARQLLSRSMSQPANPLRTQSSRSVVASTSITAEQRLLLHQRLARMNNSSSSSSSTDSPPSTLPPLE